MVSFFELMTVVYRTEITVKVLNEVTWSQNQLTARHHRIAGMTILTPAAVSLTKPSPEVREVGLIISEEFDRVGYASAMVIEPHGTQAAYFRSVLTGYQLSSQRPAPQKVFSEVAPAVRWVAARRAESPLNARVAATIDAVQRLLGERNSTPPHPPGD